MVDAALPDLVDALFPVERRRFHLVVQGRARLDQGLVARVRLVRFDAKGSVEDVVEQECILATAQEVADGEGAEALRHRVGVVPDLLDRRTNPAELFARPNAVAISDEMREYVEGWIDLQVRAGYDELEDLQDNLAELLDDELPEAPAEEAEAFRTRLDQGYAAQLRAEASWTQPTTNDRISAAFAELCNRGVVALEDAGTTMSDGWSDVHDARDTIPDAWAATFFHRQDVERGVEGDGLMLAFGAFVDGDQHEPESLRAAGLVREVLRRHGVDTAWSGTLDRRIELLPFEWRKRRSDAPTS